MCQALLGHVRSVLSLERSKQTWTGKRKKADVSLWVGMSQLAVHGVLQLLYGRLEGRIAEADELGTQPDVKRETKKFPFVRLAQPKKSTISPGTNRRR